MKITFDTEDECEPKEGDMAVFFGKVHSIKLKADGSNEFQISQLVSTYKFKTVYVSDYSLFCVSIFIALILGYAIALITNS